jgi:membrane fusion protein (multidrug efflux system)
VVDSLSPGTGAQFALLPAQNATGNFTKIVQRVPVRIRLDVPSSLRTVLLPGLSVTADVDTHRRATTAPPTQASGTSPAAPVAWLSLSAPLGASIGPAANLPSNAAPSTPNGGVQRG